ncbi:MAG: peptide-methionine (S)-S-oxide reductase MsrA [Candidatus Thermoplasmatota archaeon]|nr:peptide-methionine (S)-S-oxide reductase MsrA [Candidatus Thermoplasmatota archaeon]
MTKSIVLGGGCFWCTEAVFSVINGITSTQPGYSGGTVQNPSYETVCEGGTGHAEAVRVEYDQDVISLQEILDVFFTMHDPTSLNKQGDDIGEQYRSVIFYSDKEDESVIRRTVEEVQKEYSKKVVTAIKPLKNFYPAETYHKDYFKKNPGSLYCNAVIRPKVNKVAHAYSRLVIKI